MKRFAVTFGDVRVLLKIYPPNDNLCRGRTYVVKSRGSGTGVSESGLVRLGYQTVSDFTLR